MKCKLEVDRIVVGDVCGGEFVKLVVALENEEDGRFIRYIPFVAGRHYDYKKICVILEELARDITAFYGEEKSDEGGGQ